VPTAGKPVVFRLRVRKFFCRTRSCVRRIFTERLPDLVAPYGRKSHGLSQALRQIGVALGGEAGARLALALGMATSPDTLLSLIRHAPLIDPRQPRAIDVDEWAWRKGVSYGTVIVDLEQHRPLALLPDREADTVAAWFAARP
jgi:transposase